MAKSACPISKTHFIEKAEPIKLVINGQELVADKKEFSTGSFGWFFNGKIRWQTAQCSGRPELDGGRQQRRRALATARREIRGRSAGRAAIRAYFAWCAGSGGGSMPMYCNMARAALRPAPMARMTVAPPVTMSPPAKTPGMLVICVSGLTSM